MKYLIKFIIISLSSVLLVSCKSTDNGHLESIASSNHSGNSVEVSQSNTTNVSQSNIIEVAQSNGSFTTLLTALEATGLDATLANGASSFTVFAPTDAAFAKLGQSKITQLLNDTDALTDILLYHVIQGQVINSTTAIGAVGTTLTTANTDEVGVDFKNGGLFINDSKVVIPDVMASNGIIHAIDTVLIPTTDNPSAGNIAEVASAAGSFNTLVNALVSTGLDKVLADSEKQFTVFAPTDAAFAALGDISSLTNEQLKNILLYHVIVEKELNASALTAVSGNNIQTANGSRLLVSSKDSGLFLNLAKVITPNVDASNGIIHAIDKVLMPAANK